ncbi:CHAT domain-containing tetratricopeptide repeat protein [Sphaerisporangium sp. TRM90804]|uniref:CHAT domain-containing protein n=1 Tax=Sphaerisporangium sp. TRM90804 TaxID=3031113 RepID=UPI00244A728B|nr:CHAT domain-containing tetratricopeptide repeat protein [Sphaerisporangium sp. TRM90804]MDH2428262.1 CHAT domain-containing tetratricopeptide repeat protein [Sphaerisporangium sp. TRM90804]
MTPRPTPAAAAELLAPEEPPSDAAAPGLAEAAPGAVGRLVARAEEAVLVSGADPARARGLGQAVLAEARVTGCAEAVSVAHRAIALAARELGDLALAAGHLGRAVEAARHLPARAAQARLSLVPIHADLGDPEGALRLADLAAGHLTGLDTARLSVQRAVALGRLGRNEEAVAHCDTAITRLTGAGDPRFLAGALLNRGIAHAYLERYDAASRDLSECLAVARQAGLDHIALLAEANVPFVATRRGDIPAAFAGYRSAEQALTGYPERLAAMRADFAGALLAAYLPGEARALLERAVPELAAAGAPVALAESRLVLAQVELLVGNPHQARMTAELACAELAAQGRHAWVPLAEEVALRARLAMAPSSAAPSQAGPPRTAPPVGPTAPGASLAIREARERPEAGCGVRALLAEARSLAGRLDECGWTVPAAGLRLTAAELAVALSDHAAAGAELRLITGHAADDLTSVPDPADSPSGGTGVEGPPDGRVRAPAGRTHRVVRHHAVALRRSLRGDLPGAFAALRAGLRDATAGSDRLDDPGVRAHAVRAGERLADFGLALAMDDGGAETVLGWAEHWRAVARGRPPVLVTPERLRAALDGAALVELVRHGDGLGAVVVTEERCELRRLGSYTAATEATTRLRYGLRRASLRDTGTGTGTAEEAERLARLLLGPLAGDVADRPLIIVPTGALHTLPWPVLPPLRGRAVCVASSAEAWRAAALLQPPRLPLLPRPVDTPSSGTSPSGPLLHEEAPSPGAPVVALMEASRSGTPMAAIEARAPGGAIITAVAGPGLEHAHAEASTIVRAYRGRLCPLPGDRLPAAQVAPHRADVTRALEKADIAHIAAHGTFCAGSPLLSSLALDDGPLMAYDLLKLSRTPWLVALSACDAGMAHAPVDGAPLGLAGAFLEQGTACVVAGLVPVRDAEALALMTEFHTLLLAGRTPAEALAEAGQKTAVPGFTCFGSLGHPLGTRSHPSPAPHR